LEKLKEGHASEQIGLEEEGIIKMGLKVGVLCFVD
jgi:hypothetical protein